MFTICLLLTTKCAVAIIIAFEIDNAFDDNDFPFLNYCNLISTDD